MDSRTVNPQWDNEYRAAGYKGNSIFRIARLLGIAAIFVAVFSILYFFFIGVINADLLNLAIAAGMIIAILVSVKLLEKKKLSDMGMGFRGVDLAFFFGGVMIAVTWGIAFVIVAAFVDGDFVAPQFMDMLFSTERPIYMYAPIPLAEELFFRGYALGNTFPRMKPWQRGLLVAGLFTATQTIPYIESSSPYVILELAVFTFIFGILLNLIVSFTKSVWMGFGLRWAYSFIFSALFVAIAAAEYDFMLVMALLMILGFIVIFWGLQDAGRDAGNKRHYEDDYEGHYEGHREGDREGHYEDCQYSCE